MKDLNHNHLVYFWHVAREGSLRRASEALGLAPSTISTQIRALERALGEKLFVRRGRGMVVTEFGQSVYPYAEEIGGIARDLGTHLEGRPRGRTTRLAVGIATGVHRVLVPQFLAPVLESRERIHLVCREDRSERLQADLALQALDLVISDRPASPTVRVRSHTHPLGESATTFFATAPLADSLRRGFPRSLDGAPMLLPTAATAVRTVLDRWFDSRGIRPRVVGEFEDSGLLKTFGQAGFGVITAPTTISREVCRRYGVRPVGVAEDLLERFYAITVERRIRNPLVMAITERLRRRLRP